MALLLTCLFAFPSFAQASYDPLGSGTTKLAFDKAFLSLLKKSGVKLTAKTPARLKGSALLLPVSGGKMDPTTGKGEIGQEGALLFEKGRLSLPFKRLTLKTKRSPLQAKVGGSQLKVAQGAKIFSKRNGFGSLFSASSLELTAKIATRLNKKLHLGKAFAAGQPLGRLTSKTLPETVAILPKGKATLVPDPAFLAKLDDLFVSLNPISPAELAPGPVLYFPISAGGRIAPDASQGTLRTAGAVELLQLSGGQVFEEELWLDLGAGIASSEANVQPSPPYPGKEGRVASFAIDLAAATVSSNPTARTIAVSSAALTLGGAAARAFNEAFAEGKAVFAVGERFGSVSFTAAGQ